MTTLTAMLDEVAATHPDVAARFWTESETITYAELAAASRAMAAGLVARGVARGEPVGLLCPNAPEFLTGLFAVLAAGGAAVPLPLPMSGSGSGGYARKLAAIAGASRMRRVLVSHRFGTLGDLGGLETISTAGPFAGGGPLPPVGPDDLAIVQFTSGSTALPKGVRLTHRNVVSGLLAIREGIALGQRDGGGFWLPLFHDMGLFGTLSAVLIGIPAHVWSPLSFVKNPGRWLREFAESRATITAMPNFGYDHLLALVEPEEAAAYDLRHVRIMFNGAEPIRYESVRAFTERFAPAGLAPEAMFGVYGMAEATLAVTFPPLGRPPRFDWVDRDALAGTGRAVPAAPGAAGARAVAGVGRPVAGVRLRIVDPATGHDLPDGAVGEILIQGAPVTSGYLVAGAADAAAAAEPFADGWLRTGDLGYRRSGEVFVTGRSKEMITVRGANFYPQDVEAVARETPGVFKGRCVAVAAPSGEEEMLLIAESALTGPDADALAADLRSRVGAELGLTAVTVHLVRPRSIPRTSSGKVQRLAARDLLSPAI
ncbi:acyl-CoA synthetase (AMP-forming)/AMP-acid ligase II [Thermocatellispora tengchongensis]|uniref:Acyl-CoA synthetase (AMP-forming)/AMP-acid ligase II n=1 Tax=Thermocatellispora tengchongensis TaxID=1073253 RepID=A0A840PTD5_9ACTN|nr:AMP-binding protein [Thermocatellispora tengchongensis]MBB5139195.1 acyl-CoA synthetase (AMP-forming)/AMP-acid ligase II [Thermocatellispora tengchongensis]